MFYSINLLQHKKSALALIWNLTSDKRFKVSRKAVLEADIESYCDEISVSCGNHNEHGGRFRFSLYLLANLSRGVVMLHFKKTELLLRDHQELKEYLFRKRGTIEDKPAHEVRGAGKGAKTYLPAAGDMIMRMADEIASDPLNNRAIGSAFDFDSIVPLSEITLREEMPPPRTDDYIDDFGLITEQQRRIMEETLDGRGVNGGNVSGDAMADRTAVLESGPSDDLREDVHVDLRSPAVPLPQQAGGDDNHNTVEISAPTRESGGAMSRNGHGQPSNPLLVDNPSAVLSSLQLDQTLETMPRPRKQPPRRDEVTRLSNNELQSRMESFDDDILDPMDRLPVKLSAAALLSKRFVTLQRNAELCKALADMRRPDAMAFVADGDSDSEPSAKRFRSLTEGMRSVLSSDGDSTIAVQRGRLLMSGYMSEEQQRRYESSEDHSDSFHVFERAVGVRPLFASSLGLDDSSDSAMVFVGDRSRESAASALEHVRQSSGAYSAPRDVANMTQEEILERTRLSNLQIGPVAAQRRESHEQTPDQLLSKIQRIAQVKGEPEVLMSELVNRRASRRVAVRTFMNLLWLLKENRLTAVQTEQLGEIRITIST